MHQKAFGGRAPPDPLAAIWGPTSKGRGEGRGREEKGGDEKSLKWLPPDVIF